MRIVAVLGVVLALCAGAASAASWPAPVEGVLEVPGFRFASGETMDVRLHYTTLGKAKRGPDGHVANAVLILHGTGGSAGQFLNEDFAGVLFAPGGMLDAAKYYIVIPDGIGHGQSSKPSDGLHAKFPHYGYRDMVQAQHRVVTDALKIDHLRLVLGTSMGGMHAWLWGETYPAMMDALMPLASLPIAVSGRNRIWRDMIADLLRSDPDYRDGEYKAQPARGMAAVTNLLWVFQSAPLYDQTILTSGPRADAFYANRIKPVAAQFDANDMIYQFESSRDYDPESGLGSITAPLLAINSADDQINPPELGVAERRIGKVPKGKFVLLPVSLATRGHGTHSLPMVWSRYLAELLDQSGGRL